MIYILTINGPQVDAWITRCKLPKSFRRIYRWGNFWGIIENYLYHTVKRTFIAETTDEQSRFNLELEEPAQIQSPPLLCDDIWDEEYVEHTRGICNGLLTIVGTMKDIKMWCRTAHINVPESLWLGVQEIKYTDSPTLRSSPQRLSPHRSINSSPRKQSPQRKFTPRLNLRT